MVIIEIKCIIIILGMMQFTANNGTAGVGGGANPAVMRIGECSIKPIGQS